MQQPIFAGHTPAKGPLKTNERDLADLVEILLGTLLRRSFAQRPAENLARPFAPQLREKAPACLFLPEATNPAVGLAQGPLIHVAMLKNPPPAKIVLAHCRGQRMDGRGN